MPRDLGNQEQPEKPEDDENREKRPPEKTPFHQENNPFNLERKGRQDKPGDDFPFLGSGERTPRVPFYTPKEKPRTEHTDKVGDKSGERQSEHSGERTKERAGDRPDGAWLKFQRDEVKQEIRKVRDTQEKVRELLEAADAPPETSKIAQEAKSFAGRCDHDVTLVENLLPQLEGGDAAASSAMTFAFILLKQLSDQGSGLAAELEDADQEPEADADEEAVPNRGWRRKLKALFSEIADRIGNILSGLWTLLSRMLTPKEWTLKAELGAPLSAKGSIEIKFGPPDSKPPRK